MSDFVFTSPGVKFRERDLTFTTREVGVSTLGLVGETLKGPAFEPILIEDPTQFLTRFGSQATDKYSNGSLRYLLPYVANSYLKESNQLYVTRVLGLSGYDAGKLWALTVSAGYDPSTTGATANVTTGTGVIVNNYYLGTRLVNSGDNGSYFSGYTKTSATGFSGVLVEFTATTVSAGTGTVSTKTTVLSATSYTEYENMVVAVIRSKANVTDNVDGTPTYYFEADSLSISENSTNTGTGDLFGTFNLTVQYADDPSTSEVESTNSITYTMSLNPTMKNYIGNVIGTSVNAKNSPIFIEAIYPDLIKKLDADGKAYGLNTTIIDVDTDSVSDYNVQFQTPETPWIVSELRGSEIDRLFKFILISDGNGANKEIKISFQNIDPVTKEFDIIIRDFYDTDASVNIIESYSRCSMNPELSNYVCRKIGTYDGEYTLQSNYVMIEINKEAPIDAFPCGFEGYYQNNYALSATSSSSAVDGKTPKICYKQSYLTTDKLRKTYLGISERGYDGTSLVGSGINQNLFNYNGAIESGKVKTKGFHLDSGATSNYTNGTVVIGEFEVGAGQLQTYADINTTSDVYFDEKTRKFTLVPAGGFDGWNIYRNYRTNTDLYRKGAMYDGVDDGVTPTTDYVAWETAINTFANPEEISINLFATPGINWSDNNTLVKEVIDMVETSRADSFYVIDSPDIDISVSSDTKRSDVLAAEEIVALLDDADIDSNYSGTYFPYIQITDDQNNVNVVVPPTGEVLRSMAYTDNVAGPWRAPAGITRGTITCNKAKYNLSLDARNILYAGKINPIASFKDVGVTIWGQKTLQTKESALDRVNVRRLLLRLKLLIANISIRLLFEPNDQTVRDEFITKVTPILDTIKRERGLYDYRIKMDDSINTPESIDRHELYGQIQLKPTPSLEFIGVEFTLTNTGASFSE